MPGRCKKAGGHKKRISRQKKTGHDAGFGKNNRDKDEMAAPTNKFIEMVEPMEKINHRSLNGTGRRAYLPRLQFFGKDERFSHFLHGFAAIHGLTLNETEGCFFGESLLAH